MNDLFWGAGSVGNRFGKRWIRIGGKLMQIDSGTFGLVWGVNKAQRIYCRKGITWRKPQGTKWQHVGGLLKYLSVGQYGVWGVNRGGYIYFRYGCTRRKPQGDY